MHERVTVADIGRFVATMGPDKLEDRIKKVGSEITGGEFPMGFPMDFVKALGSEAAANGFFMGVLLTLMYTQGYGDDSPVN